MVAIVVGCRGKKRREKDGEQRLLKVLRREGKNTVARRKTTGKRPLLQPSVSKAQR